MTLNDSLVDKSFEEDPRVGHRVKFNIGLIILIQKHANQVALQSNQVREEDPFINLWVIQLEHLVLSLVLLLFARVRHEGDA